MQFSYAFSGVGEPFQAVVMNGRETVILLDVEHDDIQGWKQAFLKHATNGRHAECQKLIDNVMHLEALAPAPQDGQDDQEVLEIMWRFLYGFLAFLEDISSVNLPPDVSLRGCEKALSDLIGLMENKFLFEIQTETNIYLYGVIVNGHYLGGHYRLRPERDQRPNDIQHGWWYQLISEFINDKQGETQDNKRDDKQDETQDDKRDVKRDDKRDVLHDILSYFDFICYAAELKARHEPQTRVFIMRSLSNFWKAMIDLIENDGNFASYRRTMVPRLCSYIVKNEYTSFEVQKVYLERILSTTEEPEKNRYLREIVQDAKQDFQSSDPENKRLAKARLIGIVSPVSSYYLSQYNLRQAAEFWDLLDNEDKDPILRVVLNFYRSKKLPILILALIGGFLGLILLQAYVVPKSSPAAHVLKCFSTGYFGIVFLVPVVIWLALVLSRLLTRKGMDYFELFLPRLMGASVVGLSVLLLEDGAWKLSVQLDAINYLFISAVIYILSFLYIFVDVHKTTSLLPMPTQVDADTVSRSFAVASKVFVIGLLESFLFVLFSSVLLYEPISSGGLAEKAVVINQGNFFSLGFFPGLIWLWTSLTLFIGAFIQLIWQDSRITSPL